MTEERLKKILDPEYSICLCKKIKTQDIINIIQKNTITSLKELCEVAHVGDKCGGCREDLDAILSAYTF